VHCRNVGTVPSSVTQWVSRNLVIKTCSSRKQPQSILGPTPLSGAAVPTWHDGCCGIASPHADWWGLGWGDPGPRTGRLSGPRQSGLGSSHCVCQSLGNQGFSLKHSSKSLCQNIWQTRSKTVPACRSAGLCSFQCGQEPALQHSNSLPDRASIQQCRIGTDKSSLESS